MPDVNDIPDAPSGYMKYIERQIRKLNQHSCIAAGGDVALGFHQELQRAAYGCNTCGVWFDWLSLEEWTASEWICALCHGEILSDIENGLVDNQWRGCFTCGWKVHHGCYGERDTWGLDGWEPDVLNLACGTYLVEVPAVLYKNGKVKRAAWHCEEEPDGHGGSVLGMRGEWTVHFSD